MAATAAALTAAATADGPSPSMAYAEPPASVEERAGGAPAAAAAAVCQRVPDGEGGGRSPRQRQAVRRHLDGGHPAAAAGATGRGQGRRRRLPRQLGPAGGGDKLSVGRLRRRRQGGVASGKWQRRTGRRRRGRAPPSRRWRE